MCSDHPRTPPNLPEDERGLTTTTKIWMVCRFGMLSVVFLSTAAHALKLPGRGIVTPTRAASAASVEIYSKASCTHCVIAKDWLDEHGIEYTVHEIDSADKAKNQAHLINMLKRSDGRFTVPQIFISGEHIGGCSDMLQAAEAGTLDRKLQRIRPLTAAVR